MGKFPTSAIAMSRARICGLTTLAASTCMILALTLIWSDSARSTAGQDPVATIDFDAVFASVKAGPPGQDIPMAVTKVDFDQAFAGITEWAQRDNTPRNREKLRSAGWKRIL
jgi:hypothetical protein